MVKWHFNKAWLSFCPIAQVRLAIPFESQTSVGLKYQTRSDFGWVNEILMNCRVLERGREALGLPFYIGKCTSKGNLL